MIRDSINFELKDNIFALNNDFPDINKVNNIYIDKFIKDKNSFFSYNLTDNSNFNLKKGLSIVFWMTIKVRKILKIIPVWN